MSQAQVKAGLGNPARKKTGHNDFGPFTQFLYRGGITITFQGNTRVAAVAITGHTDGTSSGAGVGSTASAPSVARAPYHAALLAQSPRSYSR
jgi:hypothetical protein